MYQSNYIYINLNKCIKDGEYAEDLKKQKCFSSTKKIVGKKKVTIDLLQTLLNDSKVYDQICEFFENKFSKYHCGFRKGFNTQNALLSMVEKMLLGRGKKKFVEKN